MRAIVFLGEFLDFQIEVGGQMLLTRCHPTVNAVNGQTVYLQLSPEKCIVVTEPTSQWK